MHASKYSIHHKALIIALVNNSRTFVQWADKFKDILAVFEGTEDHKTCHRQMTDHMGRVDVTKFAGWVEAAQKL